ncbi:MAG: winged helix DNA-binding protein [bacterium]
MSNESNLTLVTISKSVKNLIKKGLLETYRINKNKKEKYVNLTEKSFKILKELDIEINKIIQIINKSLNKDLKKYQMLEALINIINNLLENGYIDKS